MNYKNITVAGSGVLGYQIAFQTAFHGFNVTVYDINDEVLEKADVLFVPNFGFRDLFIKKLDKWLEAGGRVIFAMPEVEVVTHENSCTSDS